MDAMAPWLHVGKRLEYTVAVFTVAFFFVFGFTLIRGAPGDMRWILWILAGTFVVPFCLAFLLAGRWVRRRALGSPDPAVGTARVASRKTRLLVYLVMVVVTVPSARVEARAIPTTISRVLLWNFTILAILVAIVEFTEWRKRRLRRV